MRDPFQVVDSMADDPGASREKVFPALLELLEAPEAVVVGAGRGFFSESLLARTKTKLFLSCIDRWDGDKGASKMEDAKRKLEPFAKSCRMIKASGLEAVERFKDGSLDMVYLDEDLSYDGLTAGIDAWWPKLRVGGIMSGHDYISGRRKVDVVRAVHDFATRMGFDIWTTNEDGKSQEEKLKSWYIFKNLLP